VFMAENDLRISMLEWLKMGFKCVYRTSLGRPNGTELALILTMTDKGPELDRWLGQHQQVGNGGCCCCCCYLDLKRNHLQGYVEVRCSCNLHVINHT
jgi:hypothetical protein